MQIIDETTSTDQMCFDKRNIFLSYGGPSDHHIPDINSLVFPFKFQCYIEMLFINIE